MLVRFALSRYLESELYEGTPPGLPAVNDVDQTAPETHRDETTRLL